MITLYGGPTPNARKIAIALEEMELPWRLELVDILAGDQLKPDFLALNPNNKTPVIVDPDGPPTRDGRFVLAESGAILLYLAEKTGRFVPKDLAGRALCWQWLMVQMSGVGPMFGQNAHFSAYATEKHPYSIARYANEVDRLLKVLNGRLGEAEYLAGAEYSIADIATYPYVLRQVETKAERLPNLVRWAKAVGARPAVKAGMESVTKYVRPETIEGGLGGLSPEQQSILFGQKQYEAAR